MTYHVKLHVFEGPLDLLLYLIKKNEIDIYNIPIADITQQYLEYLNLMDVLDLHVAGDFLVMAATLMQMKSRLLLPQEERPPDEEEEADPREELVRRLLEYQRFKEVARHLSALEQQRKGMFVRSPDPDKMLQDAGAGETTFFEASLFDLLTALSKVLIQVPKEAVHHIVQDEVTVEQQIHELLHRLVKQKTIVFQELFADAKSRMQVIAMFLALLELMRVKEVVAQQDTLFGIITIVRRDDQMAPIAQEQA